MKYDKNSKKYKSWVNPWEEEEEETAKHFKKLISPLLTVYCQWHTLISGYVKPESESKTKNHYKEISRIQTNF